MIAKDVAEVPPAEFVNSLAFLIEGVITLDGGIDYLQVGVIPIPNDDFVSYLSAIGIKATDSIGAFRANAGPVDVVLLLKNPRK